MESSIRRRILVGFIAMATVIVLGSLGYWLIGDGRWSWFDCLYMTIITITTVGYGETLSGMDQVAYARAFTVVQLVFGTGVLVYFASTVTAFIVEGDLKNALAAGRLRRRIQRMRDHVIVCGAGSTGRYILEELIQARVPVVAIDSDDRELRAIAERYPRAAYALVVGDATDDRVLVEAGLDRARGLVAALANDKDNLYIVVSARIAGSKARIIARASELSHVDKLRRAGADSTVAPDHIGSMRMASEMLRPSVVRFLDDMLRDARIYRFDEVTIGAGSPFVGKTLHEARVFEAFGMNVLAVQPDAGEPWLFNPEASLPLAAGTILIVLGSVDQVAELRAAARAA